jgi:hypothetical protein
MRECGPHATLAGTSRATYTGEQARIQDFLEGMEGGCSSFAVHPIVKEQKSRLRGPTLKAGKRTSGPKTTRFRIENKVI